MSILVLGTGGREHALAWRLKQSSSSHAVYLHPGNAGTKKSGFPSLGNIALDDKDALANRATELGVQLIVIGPEALLAKGYSDFFREKKFAVFGPSQIAAQLESSKAYAKEFMVRAAIPTAAYSIAEDRDTLIKKAAIAKPIVLKLDGLGAGKGVVVATTEEEVHDFARRIFDLAEFGPGPHKIIVEEFIQGTELSYMGLCDGRHYLALSSATDYKRIGDNDTGHNTGGMGAISPSPYLNSSLEDKIQSRIVQPILRQLQKDNIDYRGVLYVGVMIDKNQDPFVLEFNARFGDPETQAVLLRLEGDFTEMLTLTAQGMLSECPPLEFANQTSLYVVGAAEGYPAKPNVGDAISGLESIPNDVHIFYSGVSEKNRNLVTDGGRVLGLGTLAATSELAREKVYSAWKMVQWRGLQYRRDIGITRSHT